MVFQDAGGLFFNIFRQHVIKKQFPTRILAKSMISLLKEPTFYAKMGRRVPSENLLRVPWKLERVTTPIGTSSGVAIPNAAHIPPRARWRESCKAPRMGKLW